MLLRLIIAVGALGLSLSPITLDAKTIKLYINHEKPVLVFYYSPYCGYSQKVISYLKQIHKTVPMKNVINNREAKEELRKFGGIMQVPCLLIDGKPLYESDLIIQWLSEHQEDLDPA
ncbi:MAG: glutathione S-transferase N-terminal domain-containing protein [Verrucomicrobia bacterium]|nr:glutathione S-transferase N-terminal domain-containing protein [Verrucomicrobiota bacterium]